MRPSDVGFATKISRGIELKFRRSHHFPRIAGAEHHPIGIFGLVGIIPNMQIERLPAIASRQKCHEKSSVTANEFHCIIESAVSIKIASEYTLVIRFLFITLARQVPATIVSIKIRFQ